MRPKLLFFVSFFRIKSKRNHIVFPYFRHKIQEKIISLKVCDTKKMAKFIVIQSRQVSKEPHCFGDCFVKQRAVCIINVWGYTEILPKNVSWVAI